MEDRRAESYDPGRLLTYAAIIFVFILIVFVCLIIGVQILVSGEANTESWAALTGIIGWATAQAQGLYSNRFGSTRANSIKDATIAAQAQTAAVASGASSPTTGAQTP